MKTYLRSIKILTLFFLLFHQAATAQKQPVTVNCYNSYVKKGNDYKNLRNYDLAIQQYQSAKYCKSLTKSQIAQLDALIAETKKLQLNSKKIITRVYR
jgi:hypothetical protein